MNSSGSGEESVAGSCGHGNETSGSSLKFILRQAAPLKTTQKYEDRKNNNK
jgi:hypothetical protein